MTSSALENSKKKKSSAKWIREIIIYVLLFSVIAWGVDTWRAQSIVSGKAPALVVTSVQGEQIDLLALSQDKPVLVYFWATWCAVCSSVSPSVDFMAQHYPVVTVALSSGEDKRIKQYLSAKEYQFNVLNDPKGAISQAWGVSVTPTIFIVDKGEITSVTTGFTSPIGMWLRLLIA